jgi:hypothetical protein
MLGAFLIIMAIVNVEAPTATSTNAAAIAKIIKIVFNI